MGWPTAPSVGADSADDVHHAFLIECLTSGYSSDIEKSWIDRFKTNYTLLRRSDMPNKVFYTDNKTQTKAMKVMARLGLSFEAAVELMEALQGEDLEIVQQAPRGSKADAPDAD
jgi:hypothetical protein